MKSVITLNLFFSIIFENTQGLQEDREHACDKQCMKKGPEICQSADLSGYIADSPSTCQLFNENVYEHATSQIAASAPGYTSFHLFVSENNYIHYLIF